MGTHVHKIWMSTGLYDPEYPPSRIYQTINYWQSVRQLCLQPCPYPMMASSGFDLTRNQSYCTESPAMTIISMQELHHPSAHCQHRGCRVWPWAAGRYLF